MSLAAWWPEGLDPALRDRLEQAYGGSGRGYHDLRHLEEVLTHVAALLGPGDPAREAVLLAAWFHDAVYDGRPGEDEERSAQLAETLLPAAGLPEATVAEVARLVRVTTDHRPAEGDHAGQALCDADLAILAVGPDRYAGYVRGVRAEYAHVADEDFAAGRAAVLRDLLDRPRLFHTEAARSRWEARARTNVERELSGLSSG